MIKTKHTRWLHLIIIVFLFLFAIITLLGCGGSSGNSKKNIYVTDYLSSNGGSLADDGKNDLPAIKAAMANTKAGEVLYFPNGTYNLKSSWSDISNCNIQLTTGVDLCGESETGVILKTTLNDNGPNPEAPYHSNSYLIHGIAARNITISNLTLTSTWNGPYSINISTNNPDAGGPTYGIGIENLLTTATDKASSNITIDHVTIEKFRRYGVFINYGSHNISVKNCTIKNATDLGSGTGCGIVIQGDGHLTAGTNPYLETIKDTYTNLIASCIIQGSYIRHAVLLQYWTHDNRVIRCNISGTQSEGISLHGEDEYHNEISYNTISNTCSIGIVMGGSGSTHDKSGPNNWVHHNLINSSKGGISCEFGSNHEKIEDNEIRNNHDHSDGFGIQIGKSDRTIINNNNIHDNNAGSFKSIYLCHDDAQNDEPAGNPRNCTIKNNIMVGNNLNNVVVRDPLVGGDDWKTNIISN